MDKKQIIALIRQISIEKLPVHLHFQSLDFYPILERITNDRLSQIDQLPLNLQLQLKEIQALQINQESFVAEISIATSTQKILVPNIENLMLELQIPYVIDSKKLQISKPHIKTKIASSKIQNSIVNPLISGIIQKNESKLIAEIETRINPLLIDPSKIQDYLKEEERNSFEHLLSKFNYEIEQWNVDQFNEMTVLHSVLSVSTSGNLDVSHDSNIQLSLDKDQLIPLLLDKINADIKSKVEQDVVLIMIDMSETNTLVITGRAGVMNIQKEFEITTAIEFDREVQTLSLRVVDIKIEGGYLVRKGFELVKPKIRSMIESSAIVPITNLINQLDISILDLSPSIQYHLALQDVDIASVTLNPNNRNWEVGLSLASGIVTCKRKGFTVNDTSSEEI